MSADKNARIRQVLGDLEETIHGLMRAGRLPTRAPVISPHVVHKVTHFSYAEGRPTPATTTTIEDRILVPAGLELSQAQTTIRCLDEFKTAFELITEVFPDHAIEAERMLLNFACRIATAQEKESWVQDRGVEVLLDDLNCATPSWAIHARLTGVWPSEERFVVSENLSIRRLHPEDLETPRPVLCLTTSPLLNDESSAVLEWRIPSPSCRDVQEQFDTLLNSLRLYCVSSVDCTTFEPKAISFRPISSGQFGTIVRRSSKYRFELKPGTEANLDRFLRATMPVLHGAFSNLDGRDKCDYWSIAFQRYQSALLQVCSVEDAITRAVTALEALLLEGQPELKRTLAQRVAMLLRPQAVDPRRTWNVMREAYDVRSKFVHGDYSRKLDARQLSDICKASMELTRLSLLTVLFLRNRVKKKDLCSLLDDATLDQEAGARLAQTIAEATYGVVQPWSILPE